MSKLSKITKENYLEAKSVRDGIWKKLSAIDDVLDNLLLKREEAKLRKKLLGEDVNWDYSYAASECHYMFSKRRYWFKKYQKFNMAIFSFEFSIMVAEVKNNH